MVKNIEKIRDRIKGKRLVISKPGTYHLELVVDDITPTLDYCNINLSLVQYIMMVEVAGKMMVLNGTAEFPTHTIVNIYNGRIREELLNVLKHYGVEVFAYTIKNPLIS